MGNLSTWALFLALPGELTVPFISGPLFLTCDRRLCHYGLMFHFAATLQSPGSFPTYLLECVSPREILPARSSKVCHQSCPPLCWGFGMISGWVLGLLQNISYRHLQL